MAALTWGASGTRYYETGVSKGVLYVQDTNSVYGEGVVWNGLTSVSEAPDGAEATDLYADDGKYATLRSAETFGATIEAYTYPDEFMVCDGTAVAVTGVYVGQQPRRSFGFCYQTAVGSDSDTEHSAYKIHLIYNATASPSDKSYETINDSPDAITFSWEITTTPIEVTGYKGKVATLVIDSRKFTTNAQKKALADFEATLYGRDASGEGDSAVAALTPTLPAPAEVIAALTVTEDDDD